MELMSKDSQPYPLQKMLLTKYSFKYTHISLTNFVCKQTQGRSANLNTYKIQDSTNASMGGGGGGERELHNGSIRHLLQDLRDLLVGKVI